MVKNNKENLYTVLVTKLGVKTADVDNHRDWLTRLMMLSVESSAVLSAEIYPPSFVATEWVLVQEFSAMEQLKVWKKSEAYRILMEELTPYLDKKELVISESIDSTNVIVGSISVAVVTLVKEGQEKAYFAFEKKYQLAQVRAPGYRGAYVQPPLNRTSGTWITIIRFDSNQSMDQWFASDERKKLLVESNQLVSSTDLKNVTTSFPIWFPTKASAIKGPPNWKVALLILLGLYPIVMVVIKYFLPLMHGYSLAVSNFIGNILTVAFTTWLTMPFFIKVFDPWLFPNENTPRWVNPISVLTILLCLAIEVLFFLRYF